MVRFSLLGLAMLLSIPQSRSQQQNRPCGENGGCHILKAVDLLEQGPANCEEIKSIITHVRLGEIYGAECPKNRSIKALDLLELHDCDTMNSEWMLLLGNWAYSRAMHELSLGSFELALSQSYSSKDSSESLNGICSNLFMMGDYLNAEACLHQLTREYSDNLNVYTLYNVACGLIEKNQFKEAEEILSSIRLLLPKGSMHIRSFDVTRLTGAVKSGDKLLADSLYLQIKLNPDLRQQDYWEVRAISLYLLQFDMLAEWMNLQNSMESILNRTIKTELDSISFAQSNPARILYSKWRAEDLTDIVSSWKVAHNSVTLLNEGFQGIPLKESDRIQHHPVHSRLAWILGLIGFLAGLLIGAYWIKWRSWKWARSKSTEETPPSAQAQSVILSSERFLKFQSITAQLPGISRLTAKEKTTLCLLLMDLNSKEIAITLDISESYVYNLRSALRTKLKIEDGYQIGEWAELHWKSR